MSVTHKATVTINRGSGSTVPRQSTITDQGEEYIPELNCPQNAATQINFPHDVADIKSILIFASGNLVLRTNSAFPGSDSFVLDSSNFLFWNNENLAPVPFTTDITALYAVNGQSQVETATVVGTIDPGGAGNATVVVTGAGITGSPITRNVAVANNDTASQVAGKIRTDLNGVAAITALYTVGGTGATVTLTRTTPAANDGTLNISTANGTCTGLTSEASSANTTPGIASSGDVALTILALVDVTP